MLVSLPTGTKEKQSHLIKDIIFHNGLTGLQSLD